MTAERSCSLQPHPCRASLQRYLACVVPTRAAEGWSSGSLWRESQDSWREAGMVGGIVGGRREGWMVGGREGRRQ